MTTFGLLDDEEDDEMTEIVDAEIPRVDLVGKAANGVPGFLLMKSDASSLLPPEFVRSLIKAATLETSTMIAAYDADGNLIGMVDQGDITQFADPPTKQSTQPDLTPAHPSTVGTPADGQLAKAYVYVRPRSRAEGRMLLKAAAASQRRRR